MLPVHQSLGEGGSLLAGRSFDEGWSKQKEKEQLSSLVLLSKHNSQLLTEHIPCSVPLFYNRIYSLNLPFNKQ